MNTELCMLLGTVGILFVSNLVQAIVALPAIGVKSAMGNRENDPFPLTGMAGRAQRTVRNHVEGIALFAPLVLIAANIGVTNALTVLGAQLYFYARLTHAVSYILGIPYVRSLSFLVSAVALLIFAKGAFL